jgi:hypothetical protein
VIRRTLRASVALIAIPVLSVCLLAACTGTTAGHASRLTTSTSGSATRSPTPTTTTTTLPADACPAGYTPPDPNRPKVALAFTISPDLTTVHGTEHVQFTPDLPITELVFRLTANTAPTVAEGNRIVVTSARADHGALAPRYTAAGAAASTQGGLLHIPFPTTIAAGTTVTADIAFTLTVGPVSFDRFGRADGYAWFGSGQPLLAWERGFGWHTEDMIKFTAESATSEAMDTTLAVTAPADLTVIMSGDPPQPAASGGTRTWRSSIATARDVSVAVGPFQVADQIVDGVRLRVGAFSTSLRDELVPEFARAIRALVPRYGPFPFPSLSVARVPAGGGGVEYPSSILMLDGTRLVAVHETAHQWFYAMVGDSQALHPWLDEAFAQYSEQLTDDDPGPQSVLNEPGVVDRSTESYGSAEAAYYHITYDKGAAALLAARTAAGPAAWDAAVRCYVNRNAWRIANPSDFAAAIAALPAAVAVLRKAGALP